jgi:hypothetical protein
VIPSGVAAVWTFILFVVPGLVFELLVERRVPEKKGSTFKEASRVAIVSTPFSAAAIALVLVVAWAIDHHWLDLLTRWFTSGRPRTSEAIMVAAVGAVAELAVALGLLTLFWKLCGDWLYGTHHLRWESAWAFALGDPKDSNKRTEATVVLTSGRCYRGVVASFTIDRELANRELVLEQAFGRKICEVHPDGTEAQLCDKYIIMPGSVIELIRSRAIADKTPQ